MWPWPTTQVESPLTHCAQSKLFLHWQPRCHQGLCVQSNCTTTPANLGFDNPPRHSLVFSLKCCHWWCTRRHTGLREVQCHSMVLLSFFLNRTTRFQLGLEDLNGNMRNHLKPFGCFYNEVECPIISSQMPLPVMESIKSKIGSEVFSTQIWSQILRNRSKITMND